MASSRPKREGLRELDELEAVFACLAHASRRHVLLVLLARGGSMSAGQIADRFECSWPTTTRHLQKLERAGLVRVERQGRERIYRLDDARLLRVAGGFLARFARAALSPAPRPPRPRAPRSAGTGPRARG